MANLPTNNSNNLSVTSTTESGGQFQRSCILVSTLVKVTEQFLQTVNRLQNNLDNNPNNQGHFLKSVMEHYDRLNMVIRVMNIAYPTIPDDEQTNNLIEDATKKASFTAINTLCKIKDQIEPVTPQQPPQQTKPPQPPKQQQHQETLVSTVTQCMENNVKVEPIDNTIHDKLVQNYLLNQYNEAPVTTTAVIDNNQIIHKKNEYHQQTISSVQFLDQFEDTARNFAKQNSMDLNKVWESLFIHALPNDKHIWAQKAILKKNMDWYSARKYYLREYPDIKQEKQKPFFKTDPLNLVSPSVKRVMMKSAIRVNQPNAPVSSNPDTKKQIMERQSIYAEQLLTLSMKEYETIDDYNNRFKRYSTAACMNLTDPSLFKRYVSSLLPKYRQLVSDVLQLSTTSQPNNLDEMMKMSARIVQSQESSTRVQGRSCWKHAPPPAAGQPIDEERKRPSIEEFGGRPLKRFSSSCA